MYEVNVLKNLVYHQTEREYLTADVYLPDNENLTDIPCIIMLHGGGWKFGNADAYHEWGVTLAKRGICGMSINYRLSTPWYHAWPGALDDVDAACGFLVNMASEWNLDPYRMGLMGDSSGAHLSFMAAMRHEFASFKIQLIVGAYGVYDVGAWGEYAQKKWTTQPNVVVNLVGKPLQDTEAYKAASPCYTIDRVLEDNPIFDPAVFLLWGDQDNFVPCAAQSVAFAEKLKNTRLGKRLETMGVPDAAHLWFPRDITSGEINELDKYPLSEAAPRVLDFIDRVFARPRFTHPTYEGYAEGKREAYKNSAAFRRTRFKETDPLMAEYGYKGDL